MTYHEIVNVTDLQGILRFPILDTPEFYPTILFTIFIIFSLGTFFREVRKLGRGNIFSSLAVGGFVTVAVAVIFSALNLIQTQILVITLVVEIVFVALFLTSGDRR